jgi:hypothetical protein
VGVFAGPDVSESGLVLALDAGNNKSHSTNRFVSYGSGNVTETVYPPIRGTNNLTRVATGTVVGGYTVKTTDVVYSYALGGNGCHYQGHDVPIPGGVYGTFSFDYLVTGATNYPSTNYLANFENVGNSFSASGSAPNSLQDVWQRVSFTGGPSSANGAVRTLLYPGGCGGRLADSGTIYFRNPRVEWTNVDTGTENFSSMSNITTWYDMSGRGNNGTLTNTPYFFIGNINGYISFDGSDDYVTSPSSSNFAFGTGDFTLEVWIYPQSFSTYTHMIALPDQGTFALKANVSDGAIYFYSPAYSTYGSTSGWTLTLNTWNYVVFKRESSVGYAFLNGVSKGSKSGFTNSFSAQVLNIHNGWPGEFAQCGMSNIKIYNRALSAAEIQQNFNATRSRFGI